MAEPDLDSYAFGLLEDVRAAAEENGCSGPEAFTELVLEQFCNFGLSEDTVPVSVREHGMEVSGYGLASDDHFLDLFLVHYAARADAEYTMDRAAAVAGFKRLENFVSRALSGTLARSLDPRSEAAGLAGIVTDRFDKVGTVRLFVVSNARSVIRDRTLPPLTIGGRQVTCELWDLRRLANWARSGSKAEPIVAEFPQGLPCLATPVTDEDYAVYLAIVPGRDLAQLYAQHGARLLELNVRAFLQTRGAVNKGMQETLRRHPDRFMAYNNGISATAAQVDIDDTPDGGRRIGRIHNLQIVNGGQTTASIHVAQRAGEDISQVYVQVKLTVVPPDKLDTIVPQISEYSNTQNKVTASDLKANSRYHVEIEQIMRTLWAPTNVDSHWFYERARGQYVNAIAREGSPAKQKIFRQVNPATQKFGKSELAKFEHTWAMLPYLVCRGAEKNFVLFTERIEANPPTVDKDFCRHLVAKAILFRRTDKIVAAQNFGGYKANVVTYTIAKIAHATAGRIDLDRIWRDQDLSPALHATVAELCHLIRKVVTSPPAGITNVGEWTKKEACWQAVQELDWIIPEDLAAELVDVDTTADDLRTIESLGYRGWSALAEWGRTSGVLDANQLRAADEIAHALAQGWQPAGRHIRSAVALLTHARRQGLPRQRENEHDHVV